MVSSSGLSFSAYCLKDKRGEGEKSFLFISFYIILYLCAFSRGNCICFGHGHDLSKRVLDGMFSMLYQYTSAVPFRSDINRSCLLLFRCLSLCFLAGFLSKTCFFSSLINCILNSSDAIRQVRIL